MNAVNPEEVETDLKVLYLSSHAAQRQEQRDITSRESWAAVTSGTKEPCNIFGVRRWKYTWGNIVVITNEDSSKIITVYDLAGSKVDVQKAIITQDMEIQHANALKRLKDKSTWTSHTVAVIDTSGSMRTTDTEYGISRSEMVWLTLAVSFVAKALKSGERGDSDVFSLVGMVTGQNEILRGMPFDWILYNKLIEMRDTCIAMGHGDYFPALKKAQSLLIENQYGGCALALIFLSDGMPSDKLRRRGLSHAFRMEHEISEIASRIGSRLSILAVPLGVGTVHREFATLKALVNGARVYGCNATFQRPSLSAHVLGTALTKLTSTITATKVTLDRRVCRSFRKEPMPGVGSPILECNSWTKVKQECFDVCQDKERITWWTIRKTDWRKGQGWVSFPTKHTFHDPRAAGVAIKNTWFGEGAERLVKEIREIDSHGKFVGPAMVAKDSKYIHTFEHCDKLEVEKDFHKRFIKCQRIAEMCAKYFNRQVARHPAIAAGTYPQVEFLNCFVYMIRHKSGLREAYLVEQMLNIQRFDYIKWNNNEGMVKRVAVGDVQPADTTDKIEVPKESSNENVECSNDAVITRTNIDVNDIPQAFSCFSYWFSRRHFLICDIQGVLNTDRNPPTFELTDPSVHHRMSTTEDRKYGRTDHGVEGIQAFLSTHRCSPLCQMVRSYAYVSLETKDLDVDGEEIVVEESQT